MLLVLPQTPTVRPTSYLVPQPYDYYPSQAHHRYHDTPRFSVPSYSAPHQLDFFRQPSAEEIEEYEYRQALEVVNNHRRRQAEKEAAFRRQQLADAARQRHLEALVAELEQRRQEEFLAVRRAESVRSQQARARLVAAERHHALNTLLREPTGAQPTACQPRVGKRRFLTDALKQRLATESDPDISEPIQNILSSLEHRPVQSEKPKGSGEDASKLIEDLLSSIFPGLAFHTQPQPAPSTEKAQPSASDKGKGKARAVDVEEPQKPAPKSEPADEPFADILKHIMQLSKSTRAPRSSDKAGPSGSPSSSPLPTQPAVSEREQVQIERAIALSSVEHVRDTLTRLQTSFVLPTELDHYVPSTDDRDETASVSSVSSSDLTKLIPYTSTNKPVYKYENELNGLLEELDRIDSHGDAEVREKRKEVVKAIEKTLKSVEHLVGEAVDKRLSLVSATTSTAEEPVKGFDVDADVAGEVAHAQQPIDAPVVINDPTAYDTSTPVQVEEVAAIPAEVFALVEDAFSEPDPPVVTDTTAVLLGEPTSTESRFEASTATITPASAEFTPLTEPEETTSQAHVGVPGTDTLLLPESGSPSSPADKPLDIDNDADGVLTLDSDTEKSDWSELER